MLADLRQLMNDLGGLDDLDDRLVWVVITVRYVSMLG